MTKKKTDTEIERPEGRKCKGCEKPLPDFEYCMECHGVECPECRKASENKKNLRKLERAAEAMEKAVSDATAAIPVGIKRRISNMVKTVRLMVK